MKAGVTKQELVDSLANTLRLTREGIIGLELTSKHETEDTVVIYYSWGKKFVNIYMDSGIAIIRDVCRAIG